MTLRNLLKAFKAYAKSERRELIAYIKDRGHEYDSQSPEGYSESETTAWEHGYIAALESVGGFLLSESKK